MALHVTLCSVPVLLLKSPPIKIKSKEENVLNCCCNLFNNTVIIKLTVSQIFGAVTNKHTAKILFSQSFMPLSILIQIIFSDGKLFYETKYGNKQV